MSRKKIRPLRRKQVAASLPARGKTHPPPEQTRYFHAQTDDAPPSRASSSPEGSDPTHTSRGSIIDDDTLTSRGNPPTPPQPRHNENSLPPRLKVTSSSFPSPGLPPPSPPPIDLHLSDRVASSPSNSPTTDAGRRRLQLPKRESRESILRPIFSIVLPVHAISLSTTTEKDRCFICLVHLSS